MTTPANPRPDRIVVVDDDARIRDLLRRYLSQEGFDVLLAEDSKALNRVLTRETVDLIVLDLMLPGENGLEICRRLRGQGDAERNKVFAEAFQQDPEFFSFYRSMQAYEKGLTGDTRMILSPNSDFFRYFGDPAGREAGGKPRIAPTK